MNEYEAKLELFAEPGREACCISRLQRITDSDTESFRPYLSSFRISTRSFARPEWRRHGHLPAFSRGRIGTSPIETTFRHR
jgi:hypothetical protein